MAESTTEEYFPNDTYHTQWFLFWIIAVVSGVLLWLSFFRPLPITAPPRLARSAGYDWFLILHLPEVPRDPAKTDAAKRQFGQWMDALAQNGYQPLLLSDALTRLRQGVGLPDRAVVLVFDPGYDHTYQTLTPILVQYRFPALWVTDHTALLRGDRHYVNTRQTRWMVNSGLWDLGYTGDGFWGRGAAEKSGEVRIAQLPAARWSPEAGHAALTWASNLPSMNRLDVSPKWSADDLIDRLTMEIPLHGTVRLGVKKIQHRQWGIVIDSPKIDSSFILRSPLLGHSHSVYWLGTRGANDIRLTLDVPSFFGQTFVWLRDDKKTGRGIGIGFTQDQIFVDEKNPRGRQRLLAAPRASAERAIGAVITLSGNDLFIKEGKHTVTHIPLESMPGSKEAMVRLAVYDSVRGAAYADVKTMTLTPLSPSDHRP